MAISSVRLGGTNTGEQVTQFLQTLPRVSQICIAHKLSTQRISTATVLGLQGGALPDGLAALTRDCDEVANRKLRTNLECPILAGGRTIKSWCDEAFVRDAGSGTPQRMGVDEAIVAAAAGTIAPVALMERPDAQRRRDEMLRLNPSATRVPNPSWDCATTTQTTQSVICNSFTLTSLVKKLEGEFSRVPETEKRNARAKLRALEKERLQCKASSACIHKNLLASLEVTTAWADDRKSAGMAPIGDGGLQQAQAGEPQLEAITALPAASGREVASALLLEKADPTLGPQTDDATERDDLAVRQSLAAIVPVKDRLAVVDDRPTASLPHVPQRSRPDPVHVTGAVNTTGLEARLRRARSADEWAQLNGRLGLMLCTRSANIALSINDEWRLLHGVLRPRTAVESHHEA